MEHRGTLKKGGQKRVGTDALRYLTTKMGLPLGTFIRLLDQPLNFFRAPKLFLRRQIFITHHRIYEH